jgi:hypothetical protein
MPGELTREVVDRGLEQEVRRLVPFDRVRRHPEHRA